MDVWISETLIKQGENLRALACRAATHAASALTDRRLYRVFIEDQSGRAFEGSVKTAVLGDWVARSRPGVKPLYDDLEAWQVDTTRLTSGAYRVLVLEAGRVVGRGPQFTVVGPGEFDNLITRLGQEAFASSTEIRKLGELDVAWLESWASTLAYNGALERLMEVSGNNLIRLNSPTIRNLRTWQFTKHLTLESVRFVSFHVNRFLFHQLFFGGEIRRIYHDRQSKLGMTIQVRSRLPLAEQLPAGLVKLINSTADRIHGVPSLRWQRSGDDKGRLQIEWRWD